MTVSPSTLASPRPARATGWIALLLLLAVALALRIHEAMGAPLWFDELYIVLVVRHGWAEVIRIISNDIHPPGFFLLVKAWATLGGTGEAWLKVVPMVCGLATLAATYALGRRLWGSRVGLLAAALMTLDGANVHYSQELEVYPLVWLFALTIVHLGIRFVEERRARHAVAFALVTAVGAYTMYYTIAVTALTVLWGAVRLRRDGRALAAWLGMAALVALAFVPQMPVIAAQFAREGSGRWFPWPTPAGLMDLARLISLGPHYLVPVFAGFALYALGDPARRHRVALFWLLILVLPFCCRAWPLVLDRDMLVVMPFWMLLAAAGIFRLPWRRVSAVVALLLVAFAARALTLHTPFVEPRSLLKAEKALAADIPDNALIAHAETHSLLFFEYYHPDFHNVLIYPAGQRVPFYDAGLIIPDSLLMSPESFEALRARGVPWWGVHLDRASIVHGHVTRAGVRPEALMDSLATGRRWSFPPVRVYEGLPPTKP